MENKGQTVRKITLWSILGYGFGGLFIFGGVIGFFSQPLFAIFILLSGLVVFPPVGQLLKNKAHLELSKVVKIILFVVFLAIGGSITGASKNDSSPAISDTHTVTSTPGKPLTTQDKLWKDWDRFGESRKGADIVTDSSGTVTLTVTIDQYWDEKTLVEGAFNAFANFGIGAFQIDGIQKEIVIYKMPLIDTYGNKNVDEVIRLGMTKDEFTKYQWKNLEGQPIYYKMSIAADPFFVHPALLSKIDTSQIELTDIK